MIQVLHRALDIMEYCSKQPEKEHLLNEIADHLGLNHSTCANILKTLVNRKYIEQTGCRKGYRLGNMTYRLTENSFFRESLIRTSKPFMVELCDKVNETVILAVYNKHSNKRIVLHSEYCDHELQVRSRKDKDIFDTSTGRLLIAYSSKEDRQYIIQNTGLPSPAIWPEATTYEKLEHEFDKIREAGIVLQITASRIVGVAVPVFNKDIVIASLGIYLPEIRFMGELRSLIFDYLVHAGEQLSKKISGG